MPEVVIEINEEDVFAPMKQKIDALHRVPMPAKYEYRGSDPLPKPPARDVPMLDEPLALTKGDLDRLASESSETVLKVDSVSPVALKYIKGCEGKCVMCLQPLMRICMKCDSKETDYTQCSIIIGKCGHAIHQHCVAHYAKSLAGLSNCLICRRPWELESRWMLASKYCE